MNIPQNLEKDDVYSLLLFTLYGLRKDEGYSTLSELVYILDKDSLLKICEYYGGLTLKIPTIEELEIVMYGLLLYQNIDIDKKSYEEVVNDLNVSKPMLNSILDVYKDIVNVLKDYKFRGHENDS